jgi:branched-chain amino acid transport system substrate-binding protein
MITRRAAAQLLATTAVTAALGAAGAAPARAADKVVKIGVDLSLTGADAQGAIREKDGIQMAFDAANQANAVPGYTFEVVWLDDGTATAGQYDPAQAATNARKMVSERSRRRPPTPTSPARNSPANTARPASRSTSAPSRPTPTRARTWRTFTPRS